MFVPQLPNFRKVAIASTATLSILVLVLIIWGHIHNDMSALLPAITYPNFKPNKNISNNIPQLIVVINNATVHPTPTHYNINGSANQSLYKYPMTIEERLKYYLTPKWYSYFTTALKGNISNPLIINESLFYSGMRNNSKTLKFYDRFILASEKSLSFLKNKGECRRNPYCTDALHTLKLPAVNECILHTPTKRYVMQFGDSPINASNYAGKIPILIKSRYVLQNDALLMKFVKRRHFGFYFDVEAHDIPWKEKNDKVLWRGGMTGGLESSRFFVVDKYFKYGINMSNSTKNSSSFPIDIGFTAKNQNYKKWKKRGMITDHLLRKRLSMSGMLRSKYLVSIPGNDVASNFNWIMFSNSVPFAFQRAPIDSKYERETWTMHGLLQPYIHYIPFTVVDNEDDSLIKAYEFCESHSENCSRIAQNGKQWMMQFRDKERENKIEAKILALYCHSVRVVY